ncbi:putative kinesin light chain [Phaeosphaeriaceae sp. PMI808]|nr:putative kinesin light chain [Phaeosphaeriaceae sp. PMI808]
MSKTKTGDEGHAGSAFDEDLDTLQSCCLIAATADRDMYEMHALVQSCTRAWLSLFGHAEWWKQKFVELMAQTFPTGRFENWTNCQQLLPHIEPLCDTEPATDELVEERAQVLTNVAWYLCMKGSCDAAEKLATTALAARERVLGPDDEWTLRSVVVLGMVLQYQRKYEEAEKLNRRALEGTEKKLGAQHPGTLTSVGNLAVALQDQGKYEEAEKLNRRALEGWGMLLGAHHSLTLTSFNNLAMVLRYQGKYDEVEKLN